MNLIQIKATLDTTLLTSVPWSAKRQVEEGEEVWATPAINLPEDGKIKWWLTPVDEDADWYEDASGPYGVGAFLEDLSYPTPEEEECLGFDQFFDGYLVCALWSSTDEEGSPFNTEYSADDIDATALTELREEAWDFFAMNLYTLCRCRQDYSYSDAGHDFWLTRNRHGAGFWDRDLGEEGDTLTEASKVYGTCELCLDVYGTIYYHN